MGEKAGVEHYGQEIGESAEPRGQRINWGKLEKLGWQEADLRRRRKGDARRIRIALRLRRETTMTLSWIAQRLMMETRTHLSHLPILAGAQE